MATTSTKLSPLEQYAAQVTKDAQRIARYCEETGRPQISFDPEAPIVKIAEDAPDDVHEARRSLIAGSIRMRNLAAEPRDYVLNLQPYYQAFQSVRWLCHFDIPKLLPAKGSISYKELAEKAGVPFSQLKSLARTAMLTNFLTEPVSGEVAHSANSRLFAEKPSVLQWFLWCAEVSAEGAAKMAAQTEKWGLTDKKNETAINLAWNTDLPFFDFLDTQPDLRKRFAALMNNVTESPSAKNDHLVNGYDWKALGASKIIDIGGSGGHTTISLAQAYPELTFVVEDLPDTVKYTPERLAPLEESVKSRISTQGYDFFTKQPILDGDVYFLRMILHDWPDVEAVKIIRNQLPALKSKPGKRLIINDTLLPAPGAIADHEEAILRCRDLHMQQTFNAKERDLSEWTDLFNRAVAEENEATGDKGALKITSAVNPPGSAMAILEVVYESN